MVTKKVENSNRHKLSQFFLTFPRWEEYENLEVLYKMFPPLKWGYFVKEMHDEVDPDPNRESMIHYHVSIILRNPISKKKLINWFTEICPLDYKRIDVEATRNFEATIKYMQKESKICFEVGDRPKSISEKKAGTLQKITITDADVTYGVMNMLKETKWMKMMKYCTLIRRHLWDSDSFGELKCENFLNNMKYVRGR